jgi:hypothetical protein
MAAGADSPDARWIAAKSAAAEETVARQSWHSRRCLFSTTAAAGGSALSKRSNASSLERCCNPHA